jgi:hypothetical protein
MGSADLAKAFLPHDEMLTRQVDAFASRNYREAHELAYSSYRDMFGLARQLSDAFGETVAALLQPGPAAMLQGLSRIESHGARQTAEAVELALHQLPVKTDDPRLIVLYTAAPDAAGYPAADLIARLTSAGVVLAVVAAVGDAAAAPPYWSSVAAATGGVAVGVRDAQVLDAFARLHTALRTRYLLTFPAPNRLPADAVVRIDTPTGPLTGGAVIPAPTLAPAVNAPGSRDGQPVGPALGLVALALLVGGAAVARARSRRPGTALIAPPTPTNRRPGSAGNSSVENRRPDIHPMPAPLERREQHRDEHPGPTEPTNGAVAGPVWNIPSRRTCGVEREPGHATIRTALRAGRPVVLQAADDTAGLGVTTAMIEYAHRNRDQYDIAWWITAEDPPLVSDQMAQLAQALGLAAPTDTAEQATARVLEALRRRDRWLLIFDDAASARQLVRFLPPGPGHIIVGSPDPEWRAQGTVVSVQRFTRAESIELLQTRLPALQADEADQLAAALEDLPLALDLAAATVSGTEMSVDTYLHLISLHRTDGATQPTPSVPACSVALDRLSVDDPPASALLTIAAWLGRQPIPPSLLTRHADQLPAPLAQPARSPAQLADLAATLHRRGLARVKSNSVQLHRTPADQLLARTVDDRPDQSTWAAWAVRLLHAAMPTQLHDPNGWPMWRQLLPHVLTATDPTHHLDDVPIEVGWLLNQAPATCRPAANHGPPGRCSKTPTTSTAADSATTIPTPSPLPAPSSGTCTLSASTSKPVGSVMTPTSTSHGPTRSMTRFSSSIRSSSARASGHDSEADHGQVVVQRTCRRRNAGCYEPGLERLSPRRTRRRRARLERRPAAQPNAESDRPCRPVPAWSPLPCRCRETPLSRTLHCVDRFTVPSPATRGGRRTGSRRQRRCA